MKIYLDDERVVPTGFVGVKTFDDFVKMVNDNINDITHISFDHDLGTDKTGYDCAVYIEMLVHTACFNPCVMTCHSMNPVGKMRINQVFRSIQNRWNG